MLTARQVKSAKYKGGTGVLIKKGDSLVQYHMQGVTAGCALQTEGLAVLKGLQLIGSLGIRACTIYSDSASLVTFASQSQPPIEADWRAFREVYEVWEALQRNTDLQLIHLPRGLNEMADKLAKRGRLMAQDYTGYTYPLFKEHDTEN